MRVLPMGADAVLLEDPPGGPAAWSVGFRNLMLPGVIDVVPAARTVLVRCGTGTTLADALDRIDDVMVDPAGLAEIETVTIDVNYDGQDLEAVASEVGLTPEAVVAVHSAATYAVAFCGFAPGFGYLTGLPAALHLPRRPSPRSNVPAGSVAIAAEYAAVYPRSSPGGWHLLGRTSRVLFDPDREPPAVFRPGVHVRFRPIQ